MRRTSHAAAALVAAVAAAALAACSTPPAGPVNTVVSAGPGVPGPVSGTGSPATRTAGTPAAGAPTEITVVGTGDLLTHVAVRQSAQRYGARSGRAYDFAPMFAPVRSAIAGADLALCHLETPLSPTDTDLTRPRILSFNTPHELADAVRATGWDGCDFATNHSLDRGRAGVEATRAVLTSAGLGYAGPGFSAAAPRYTATYEVKGVRVAHLAYSYTALNDWGPNTTVPPDMPYATAWLWPARKAAGILADARRARAAGARVVVVSLHWGAEYQTAPTPDQRDLARALLSSPDVDLVLGTHVHVVQPCERIAGKYVFYGLGNFLSNQSPEVDRSLRPETQEGVVATVTLRLGADGTVTEAAAYQPTRVDLAGHVVRPTSAGSQTASWARVVRTLGSLGPGRCPATALGASP